MKLGRLSHDGTGAVNVLVVVLIIILMVSASTVAIILYDTDQIGGSSGGVRTVVEGDVIDVNYIGQYDIGGQLYVFDTSLWNVASNDGLYLKTPEFTLRGNESAYKPLQFTVGTGTVISGFDTGVIGMRINETKVLTIPPDEGYGDLDPTKLHAIDMTVQVDLFQNMSFTEFHEKYDITPEEGLTISDPFYGWSVLVWEVNADANRTMVMNSPDLQDLYPVYGDPEAESPTGWYVEVSDINAETITVTHLLSAVDSGLVKGEDDDGNTFIVEDIDPSAGTMTFNFNRGVVGKTLVFTVTLVSIQE